MGRLAFNEGLVGLNLGDFKLTHYVCRGHTDCEGGVELQER
jgi:hypothetical protein